MILPPLAVNGITELDVDDDIDEPLTLFATTVNVYEVPAVRPFTFNGEEDPLPVTLPGFEVAVYPVIELPPVAFALKVILALSNPYEVEISVGACGTVVAVILFDELEDIEVPLAFVAVIVNVYEEPD